MKPCALVVDDDPDIIREVKDILETLSHECEAADSVTAARQCMARKKYTYFVIDLQIPVHSGHSIPRIQNGENLIDEIIRQDEGRKERIIAITAHGNDGPHQAVEIMKKGIADYIPKPFPTSDKTLDKAILAMLVRVEGTAVMTSELDAVEQPATRTPFAGGEIVFHADYVELGGRDICSGPRSGQTRKALEALRQRLAIGTFRSFPSKTLATIIGKEKGAPGVPGLIRDIRKRIIEELRQINIQCQRDDVIERTDKGYRFRDWITVQDGLGSIGAGIEGHGSEKAGYNVPNRDDPNVLNVRDDDVPNVRDDTSGNRRAWILQQLAEERRLKAPDVADQFECSVKTAQRDLQALKEEGHIKYVGDARTGYYCMRKPRKSSQ